VPRVGSSEGTSGEELQVYLIEDDPDHIILITRALRDTEHVVQTHPIRRRHSMRCMRRNDFPI
jgi:hypothetical protein